MLPVLIFDKLVLDGWPAMPRRQLNRILKKAWARVGMHWLSVYLKKHFTKGGAHEYRYVEASYRKHLAWARRIVEGGRYVRGPLSRAEKAALSTVRRLKRQGRHLAPDHDKSLVLTGDFRSAALSPGNWSVRATKKGVRVGVRHPPRRQHTADKLRLVSKRERRVLANVYVGEVHAGLEAHRGRKTIRLR